MSFDEHEHIETEGVYKEEHESENQSAAEQNDLDGRVTISEDVIAQIAERALASVEGVVPAAPGLMANLWGSRKASNGVKISMSEGDAHEVQVDTYISVKYGLRIPDVCWDVQEAIKDQVESLAGYAVKAVNVYVQGIIMAESEPARESGETAGE